MPKLTHLLWYASFKSIGEGSYTHIMYKCWIHREKHGGVRFFSPSFFYHWTRSSLIFSNFFLLSTWTSSIYSPVEAWEIIDYPKLKNRKLLFFSFMPSQLAELVCHYLRLSVRGFLGGSEVKNLPIMQETQVRSLGWEDPLEKEMATRILSLEIPRTEEPGRLQSMGLKESDMTERLSRHSRSYFNCFSKGYLMEAKPSCVILVLRNCILNRDAYVHKCSFYMVS